MENELFGKCGSEIRKPKKSKIENVISHFNFEKKMD